MRKPDGTRFSFSLLNAVFLTYFNQVSELFSCSLDIVAFERKEGPSMRVTNGNDAKAAAAPRSLPVQLYTLAYNGTNSSGLMKELHWLLKVNCAEVRNVVYVLIDNSWKKPSVTD